MQFESMQSECGLCTILHCLEWYKLVPRVRLPSLAVRYLVRTENKKETKL